MIEFEVLLSGNELEGFRVRGHAGYAEAGRDIVCAAVSVLVYNFINSAERFADTQLTVRDGGDELACRFPGLLNSRAKLLFDSMLFGIEQVAEQYPEHVRILHGSAR
ncbi:ribosomal-processing cysteine protease Prp [Alicyclobacillus mali]|uniref:Ribosomal processing cysteine protease Prp n=1 Tax=Alicyclobacillus mali (ex Roth et al. 2021) TaxID=1123961 RepID=A0ABS0F612_9BACL|nr:ribosomal-processing cysteine protease Prp [Alicyclobacillus mali (ex Roth et al. 2021)]MBF8378741.1 ribosomal-processing cysteine protease Prp [Alicyclobacillus mali (ex Roth et al. 2021)]MCL6488218.1 ribosomal-processing cysteine protease Prp [Alicyclobacillus mali (ex Roth et al. 2021)]